MVEEVSEVDEESLSLHSIPPQALLLAFVTCGVLKLIVLSRERTALKELLYKSIY